MPLKIIIVGAGIGGLAAATALNRQGHEVEVFERSSFSNEVGAAISVAPNATRILKSWDCNFEDLHAVKCERMYTLGADGKPLHPPFISSQLQAELGLSDDWLLAHRVDLHTALRSLATQEVNGRKATIRLASKVKSVDANAGEIHLEDGQVYRADLVIGADGVHSKAVAGLARTQPKNVDSGQNVFRFLVPVEKLDQRPQTKSFYEQYAKHAIVAVKSKDTKFVIYPCRDGKLVNCAVIFPSGPHDEVPESSYLAAGKLEDLLKTVKDFNQEMRDLCSLAEDIKLWSLATRDPPRKFASGRLAVMGDAAHPTLPHQGQGGSQAIEDAAALGALFTQDVTPEDIPARLELYQKVRYDHSITVMMMSRVDDDNHAQVMDDLREFVPDAKLRPSMYPYNWSSDPARDARNLVAAMN